METILVLPIYLALIGSTLWVGDLMWNRLDLTAQERMAAWSPRWNTPIPADSTVSSQPLGDWYTRSSASSLRSVTMPSWTKGFLSLTTIFYNTPPLDDAENVPGRGRNLEYVTYVRQTDLNPLRSSFGSGTTLNDDPVVSSKPDDDNFIGRKIGMGAWHEIYIQPWPHAGSTGGLAFPGKVKPYERVEDYIELSK